MKKVNFGRFEDLWESQKGLCFYCERRLIKPFSARRKDGGQPGRMATFDHVIPKSRGGGRGENLVLACYKCNHEKGSLRPEEWQNGMTKDNKGFRLIDSGWVWIGEEKIW